MKRVLLVLSVVIFGFCFASCSPKTPNDAALDNIPDDDAFILTTASVDSEEANDINKEEPEDTPDINENQYDDDTLIFIAVCENLREKLDSTPEETTDSLRKFPYPYHAMLSITSDTDNATVELFEEMHRFLNTFEETIYGTGLGLDIGDSFFVYNGSNYPEANNMMSLCEQTDPNTLRDAFAIKKYFDCGWIDSMHSFGDFSRKGKTLFTRELGEQAWDLLDTLGINPVVWIDHGTETNVQNFGAYNPKNASSYQAGDNPESPYYHTDITIARGIKYVWYSRHSNQFGQDFPLKPLTLRDGSVVWNFTRYTSEMVGNTIDWTWERNRINDQINAERLDGIERNNQYCIIAQHLTKPEIPIGEKDITALRLLAERFHVDKSILVVKTSRLLDYAVVQKYLSYSLVESEGYTGIRINGINDPVTGFRSVETNELKGITFYCGAPEKVVIFNGEDMLYSESLQVNNTDETGCRSVTIPWFEADTTDYTLSKN